MKKIAIFVVTAMMMAACGGSGGGSGIGKQDDPEQVAIAYVTAHFNNDFKTMKLISAESNSSTVEQYERITKEHKTPKIKINRILGPNIINEGDDEVVAYVNVEIVLGEELKHISEFRLGMEKKDGKWYVTYDY